MGDFARTRGFQDYGRLKSNIIIIIVVMILNISMYIIIPFHICPHSSSNQMEIIDSTHPTSLQNANDRRLSRIRRLQYYGRLKPNTTIITPEISTYINIPRVISGSTARGVR
jgi:hypothetical protein